MIRIEMLPAKFGDCLLVEYGKTAVPTRILVDAGLKATYKDALYPRLEELGIPVSVELLVVTHIDRDHICGILPLLEEAPAVIKPDDVWFNGHRHLVDDMLGTAEAEALGKLLTKKHLPWNAAFGGKAIVVPDKGALPMWEMPGGATITLLSPTVKNLQTLANNWDDKLGNWDQDAEGEDGTSEGPPDLLGKRKPLDELDIEIVEGLQSSPFNEDAAVPNGSSIAFLFEYDDKRILFAGDAHPSVIARSLDRYSPGAPVKLAAFKLSHHGSEANLSPDLLKKVKCPHFLVSSNGDSFGHPNPETLARIVATKGRTIHFNYATAYTTIWDNDEVKEHFGYKTKYPVEGEEGYSLEL